MNDILRMLSGSDLRSDGLANEVVTLVEENPFLIKELLEGLIQADDVIRGRTADALEKITRDRPELVQTQFSLLVNTAAKDPISMVRWHTAMILTNLLSMETNVDEIERTLVRLLDDESAIVRSWSISGLCIFGRKFPQRRDQIISRITRLEQDPSIAVRHRTTQAVKFLINERLAISPGWVKSRRIRGI